MLNECVWENTHFDTFLHCSNVVTEKPQNVRSISLMSILSMKQIATQVKLENFILNNKLFLIKCVVHGTRFSIVRKDEKNILNVIYNCSNYIKFKCSNKYSCILFTLPLMPMLFRLFAILHIYCGNGPCENNLSSGIFTIIHQSIFILYACSSTYHVWILPRCLPLIK